MKPSDSKERRCARGRKFRANKIGKKQKAIERAAMPPGAAVHEELAADMEARKADQAKRAAYVASWKESVKEEAPPEPKREQYIVEKVTLGPDGHTVEQRIPIPPTKPSLQHLAEFTHDRQVQIARQRLAHDRANNPNPKRPYFPESNAFGFANPYGIVSQNISNEGYMSKAQRFFGWPDDSI